MRTNPYPVPPSRTWTLAALATYGALAIAGGIVLFVLATSFQPVTGVLVLGLWGGLTCPSALACFYGVARGRYRVEWIASWVLAMGMTVYLVVTIMGTIQAGAATLITSAPTLLVFVALIGKILERAIQLSLIDLQARKRVQTRQAVTGEIPEVPVDE